MNAQPLQRTKEWQATRTGRITGSRVGAILGLSKYRTRDDVMREMVRQALGAASEFTGNEATRYGEAHEADAINAYEQRYGALVMPSSLVVHPQYEWLGASPDGLVGNDGMVEVKCPFRAKYIEPSAEYIAQMQLQMACTERAWCDFVIWREGEPIIVQHVTRASGWIGDVLGDLQAFHDEYHTTIASKDLAAPYLIDKERDGPVWRAAVAEWQEAQLQLATAKERDEAARASLIELAPQGAKGCGVQVVKVERAGTIRYADALKAMLPDVDLTPWRGKPSIGYQILESKA